MTLPFRRRHHDAEAGHDRARSLWSIEMNEPLDERDASWLAAHLDGCTECRLEHEAQAADRSLLRSLRDRPIEPPRDLWARTSAAIEREAARGSRGGRSLPTLVPARARVPLGVLSGVLVVIVVVAVSFVPGGSIVPQPAGSGGSSGIANGTSSPGPSPLAVAAAPLTYVTTAPDGSIRIIHANVDEVCPTEKTGCAPLQQQTQSSMTLGAPAQDLVVSPNSGQLVVVPRPDGSHAGSVLVVPVPTPAASPAPGSSAPASNPTTAPTTTATVTPTAPPSSGPSASPAASEGPTPAPTPEGARSIADGVVVVGEARYSEDGQWLAFSAAPLDGSTGPDLYVWNGTDPVAVRVTSDHATYFSSWFGDQILASRLADATGAPAASPAGASAAPSTAPSPGGSVERPVVVELHATSFVLDPATLASQPLTVPDVWLPTVDRTGRFVTYWAGTLLGGPGAHGIQPAAGHLVLDGWLEPLDTAGAPAKSPAGSPDGSPTVGPAGTPVELAPGPITAFEAAFDPSGTRLAVWVADAADPTIGTLRLVVLDHGRGRVDARPSPLPAVRALRGVSIDQNRLAWVTPPGQDGNQSTVQVLAWSNDDFGQVESVPGDQLTIVH